MPHCWSEGGEVVEFSLHRYSNENVILVAPELEEKFKKFLNQNVEAVGELKINDQGVKYLRVTRIRRINFLGKSLG